MKSLFLDKIRSLQTCARNCLCQTSKSLNQFFAVDIDDNNYLMYYQVRRCNVQ